MRNFFKIWLPIILLVFVAFWVTSKFIKPAPKKRLTIAAGSVDGGYHKVALEYKKLLEEDNVKVDILETPKIRSKFTTFDFHIFKNCTSDLNFGNFYIFLFF